MSWGTLEAADRYKMFKMSSALVVAEAKYLGRAGFKINHRERLFISLKEVLAYCSIPQKGKEGPTYIVLCFGWELLTWRQTNKRI